MTDEFTLTKKKQQRVEQRKPEILRGTKLAPNVGIEQKYYKDLEVLIIQMTRQCKREVLKFFRSDTAKEFYAADDSISSQARIITNQLTKKFSQLFADRAEGIATSMINSNDKASSSSLHQSLKELSGGLTLKTSVLTGDLKEVVKASITENVGLINSISTKYLTEMQGAVMRSITSGQGLADLVPFFERYEGITRRRAVFIATDQTRKVYGALNAGRMEKLDLDEYEWLHSAGGAEPRELHEALSGKVCSLKNPPIIQYAKGNQPQVRGKPGDLPGCKCTMRPVVTFAQMRGEK